MTKIIFLIDMNSYFASIEQVDNPSLRGKPIVVCGQGRTVVTTSSYEARKFGVKTGMSVPEAKRLCPTLIPVIGDMDKYVATSLKIHKILLEFTDQVEPFSIDECFLDVTVSCGKNTDPRDMASEIKQRIKKELGLTCSIGIGPNKVLAKLASKMQKPDGLVMINHTDVPALFSRMLVEELQGVGIGKKTSDKLKTLGILTAHQLGNAPDDLMSAHFGILGAQLKSIGRGEDDSIVKMYDVHEQVKSVGHSHTLPKDTKDLKVINSYLLMLSEKVGARLRETGLMGKTISVTVRYSDFHTFSKQKSLSQHVTTGQDIYHTSYEIFKSILPLKLPVRLVGVSIGNLTQNDNQQFLFGDMEKRRTLTTHLDAINKKYGPLTIKPSSLLIAEKFGISKPCGMTEKTRLKKPLHKDSCGL